MPKITQTGKMQPKDRQEPAWNNAINLNYWWWFHDVRFLAMFEAIHWHNLLITFWAKEVDYRNSLWKMWLQSGSKFENNLKSFLIHDIHIVSRGLDGFLCDNIGESVESWKFTSAFNTTYDNSAIVFMNFCLMCTSPFSLSTLETS